MTRPSEATLLAQYAHNHAARTIAATLHPTTTLLRCPALVALGSALHASRFRDEFGCQPVWATYHLNRAASPTHALEFGDGSRVPLLADDLQDVLLLTAADDPALLEVFA
ncbi:MAG: hypothetical protein DI635_00720 [Pseudoxanthomonas suwonensis]|nr:MAG: hypothetical protein DI635_00720 [Pseudoxanthomonas suwonensis]